MRAVAFAAVAALSCATALAAQQSRPATPEALADRVGALNIAGDWAGLADLMDPDQMARVHTTFGALLALEGDPALYEMFDVSDLAGYNALSPRAVMAALLRIAEAEGGLADVEIASSTMLGVVSEGSDTAHVVFRQVADTPYGSLSVADVLTMHRIADGWVLLMTPDLEGTLLGIETAIYGADHAD